MPELYVVHKTSAHDLSMIPDKSIHTCVTSPPYWALRNYAGEQVVEWPRVTYRPMPGLYYGTYSTHPDDGLTVGPMTCALGSEDSPEAYIAHMVLVMRQVWRVLRDDGTVWLNIGDSRRAYGEIKPKDLSGIPWRLAFALQADGWYLRSDIPWIKRNAMPDSTEDRPTTGHEYIFLLSKQESYYYDIDAIRVAYSAPLNRWGGDKLKAKGESDRDAAIGQEWYRDRNMRPNPDGRQRRTTDWWFESLDDVIEHLTFIKEHGGLLVDGEGIPIGLQANPVAYEKAHYAVFPPKLVEPCILAGTSEKGCCPACGAGWVRVMEVIRENYKEFDHPERTGGAISGGVGKNFPDTVRRMLGWKPACQCYGEAVGAISPADEVAWWQGSYAVPCSVLDPFAGSGTTGRVAISLGRQAVLCDISGEYLEEHVPDRLTVQMKLL